MPYARHVYHVYAIRTPHRESVQRALHDQAIQTGIHYPIPVHLQKAYSHLGKGPNSLPVTERAADELLSLPMYAELKEEEIATVCAHIRKSVDR
jgi:dTDP-4-amino-4,6-dideoxygalactose transaminase